MTLIDKGWDESGKGDIIFEIKDVKETVLQLKNKLCECSEQNIDEEGNIITCQYCLIIENIFGDFEK